MVCLSISDVAALSTSTRETTVQRLLDYPAPTASKAGAANAGEAQGTRRRRPVRQQHEASGGRPAAWGSARERSGG